MERSSGTKSTSTHSARKEGRDSTASKERGKPEFQSSRKARGVSSTGGVQLEKEKRKARSEKKFETVKDVDDEIARLKPPPRTLLWTNFRDEYGLQVEGANPHRFKKGEVPEKLLSELFGKAQGDQGRGGYKWQDCQVPEVVGRIEFLHPILYQHGDDDMPGLITIKFAEGVAEEYEKGDGHVNWCLFGQETNKRQRNRFKQDLEKLEALKKTFLQKQPLDVRGKEWRAIKVEPGLQEDRTKGGAETAPLRFLGRPSITEGNACGGTRPRSERSGECDTTFESGLGSGVCAEGEAEDGERGGALYTKAAIADRHKDVESLMNVLHLEMQSFRARRKEATAKRDECSTKKRESECRIESYQAQMCVKINLIKELQEAGENVDREKIKMEGLQEQLDGEEARLRAAKVEFEAAEEVATNLGFNVDNHQLQFDALTVELCQLKRGKSSVIFWPRPMFYSHEQPVESVDERNWIKVGLCSLCQFPFPQNNIVVASCRHLYHPFCASVLFVSSSRCIARGCKALAHPDWHRSFGWGEPNADLTERALMLGLAEERRRILKDRSDEARARCPTVGKQLFSSLH